MLWVIILYFNKRMAFLPVIMCQYLGTILAFLYIHFKQHYCGDNLFLILVFQSIYCRAYFRKIHFSKKCNCYGQVYIQVNIYFFIITNDLINKIKKIRFNRVNGQFFFENYFKIKTNKTIHIKKLMNKCTLYLIKKPSKCFPCERARTVHE